MQKIFHTQMVLLVVCFFTNRLCFSQAELKTVSSVMVGETVTIHSQFKGLPIVEPHLSAHPSDSLHLLAAAMIITNINQPYQSARLSSFVSKDGGQTWKETPHDYWGYDPWTAILPDGQTAMSWLGTSGSFKHQFPIQFFSSDNGGESWKDEVQTFKSNHGHDGTKITGFKNNFFFTTVRFKDDMSADVILYQRTGNGSFNEITLVPSQGVRLNFCEPVILSDDTILIPSSHYLRKAWVQSYDLRAKVLSPKHLITTRPGGSRGYMRMTADTSPLSKFRNQIYFLRAADGVWLNYSIDKGETWSTDVRVDQFENGLPSKAMVASIVTNKEGVVGISWVDSQHNPNQEKYDVYFSYSIDGGMSFSKPARITKISTSPRSESNGDVANKFPGGGHYLNIVAKANGKFQLIWSDSRNGFFELQTCEVLFRWSP
ncbi:BNR/Asp-box repeat-containing protein [Reichenbachiella faecimaris]|uniref:BNR/Asp-box repeat-containing protein n=1 Tax=Reichenbachiella faecimaris TaxID=692418 RepID=A0A1W2GJP9_REIFA|nr:sialidase family protein [Reichenbachiella faecimaris]SMD36712.1 BNR/Asp-box repeat-containing protein [Reichenbachiella faecimaris]